MNGAESLVRTLVNCDVTVSFANPGTSEMHFVSALDRVDGMRCVLCLFEGVATGAADGYGRMLDRPASTLLHLGPGLANGIANLHNARRARSPILNIVGEHATYHRGYDSPLTSDIEGLARTFSSWVRTSENSANIASDGAAAVVAAHQPPGGIATLILPADTAWRPGGQVVPGFQNPTRRSVEAARVDDIARRLRKAGNPVLYVGDRCLRGKGAALAKVIACSVDGRVLAPYASARLERGGDIPYIERIPYPVEAAVKALDGVDLIVLVGTTQPVAFFAYPDKPSLPHHPECELIELASAAEDQLRALESLAEALNAKPPSNLAEGMERPSVPTGALNPASIGTILGAHLPEGAIVCDESISTGRNFFAATRGAPRHDWLQMTGGSIGIGMPLATGAAVACPDRKVITLQADGSGLYTSQALWTQARENLDVLTLVWANRSYATLHNELANVGAVAGPKARDMLTLDRPNIDWTSLAKGYGVESARASTTEQLSDLLASALRRKGPFLVEVMF